MLTLALKQFQGSRANAAFTCMSFRWLRALMDLLPTAEAPEGPLGEHSVSWGSPSPFLMLIRGIQLICSNLKPRWIMEKEEQSSRVLFASASPALLKRLPWSDLFHRVRWLGSEVASAGTKAPNRQRMSSKKGGCRFYWPTLICKTFFFFFLFPPK